MNFRFKNTEKFVRQSLCIDDCFELKVSLIKKQSFKNMTRFIYFVSYDDMRYMGIVIESINDKYYDYDFVVDIYPYSDCISFNEDDF